MGKDKDTMQCHICKKTISSLSAAKTSHFRSHVKDGSATEEKGEDGRLVFKPTDKKPKTEEDKEREKAAKKEAWIQKREELKAAKAKKEEAVARMSAASSSVARGHCYTREKVKAKVLKNGDVMLECKKCHKPTKAIVSLADPRFFRVFCCGALTLIGVRAATGVTGEVIY